MKLVIQVVTDASVTVEQRVIGEIGRGFVVLIGVQDSDTEETAKRMLEKMLKLRIFADENGKTNLDLAAVGGSLLLISQFTLYADVRKGNRPSFVKAGAPDHANALYEYMIGFCRERLGQERVQTGEFGADMKVALTNDGPFTIVMDSEQLGY